MEKYTFREFKSVDYEAWRQLAEKTLKGKPFEGICTETYENITLQPLYTKENTDTVFAQVNVPVGRKTIAQELWANSPTETNHAVLRAVAHGQNVLHLLLDQATLLGRDSDEALSNTVLSGGFPINCLADVESVLQGVQVEKYPFLLYTGYWAAPLLAIAAAYGRKTGTALSGTIGADPLGYLAAEGKIPFTLEQSFDAMSGAVKWSNQHMPNVRTVFVRTDAYHNAGANAVQELAIALATAVEYIREGMKRGLTANDICRHITFSLSVGTQLFMEIAKLRAIRVLWKKAAESFGASDTTTTHLHVRTSRRTKTLYDHHVNLLRATTEAFSALVGGADTIHVSTYNEAYDILERNGERWARNIQHILHGESHAAKVADPASGSYYVEELTKQVAEKAWELFQEIEARGGMSCVLKQGWLQAQIAKIAKQRYRNVTALEQKIVGTNVYVNRDEQRLQIERGQGGEQAKRRISEMVKYKEQRLVSADLQHVLLLHDERTFSDLVQACAVGATVGEITALFAGAGESIEALPTMRDAEPFEQLREASEAYEKRTGIRPYAHIVKLATETKGKGIAQLVKSMLEACGYHVITTQQTDASIAANATFVEGDIQSVKEALASFMEAGQIGKIYAIGCFSELEKQELTGKGASGFLQEADHVLPLLYALHNELEVIA